MKSIELANRDEGRERETYPSASEISLNTVMCQPALCNVMIYTLNDIKVSLNQCINLYKVMTSKML